MIRDAASLLHLELGTPRWAEPGNFRPRLPDIQPRPSTAVPYIFRIWKRKGCGRFKRLILMASPTGFEPVLPP